jgi:hypothetical protein
MLPTPLDTVRDLLAAASLCHVAGRSAKAADPVDVAGELLADCGPARDIPGSQRDRWSG